MATNKRILESRNSREGWYEGRYLTPRHNGIIKAHRRNACWGLRFRTFDYLWQPEAAPKEPE